MKEFDNERPVVHNKCIANQQVEFTLFNKVLRYKRQPDDNLHLQTNSLHQDSLKNQQK